MVVYYEEEMWRKEEEVLIEWIKIKLNLFKR